MSKYIKIAFIIPHKGREELLEKTVDSIINQKDREIAFDISTIVVSQNEKAPLDGILLKERRGITVVSMPQDLTISALRNTGVKHSDADYFAFIDADMHLSENWVASMLTELNSIDGRVIVSSYEHIPEKATSIEKIRVLLNNHTKDTNVPFMTGRNLFLTRKTFEAIGGFPENLVTAEDYYFTGKASELGDLYMSSKAFAIHLGEDKNYWEMFRKEIWRSRANYFSMKGRKVPLSEIPSLIIPLWIAFIYLAFPISFYFYTFLQFSLPALLLMFLFPVTLYSIRCWKICSAKVSIFHIIPFYCVYFAARGLGVFVGIKDLLFGR